MVAWNRQKGLLVSGLTRFDHTEPLASDQGEYASVSLATESRWRAMGRVWWWTGRASQCSANLPRNYLFVLQKRGKNLPCIHIFSCSSILFSTVVTVSAVYVEGILSCASSSQTHGAIL